MSKAEYVEQIIDGVVDRIYHPQPGMMTGLTELDKLTFGIHKKQLTIIAGRPSMGKSAFALDVLLNLTKNGHTSAFLTMEDSADMVVRRLLAKIAKVSMTNMRDNTLGDRERKSITEAVNILRGYKLLVDDTPSMTPATIYQKVKFLKNNTDVQTVFIDYLQLLNFGGDNRQEGLERASVLLKDVSKEFDVGVVVLSQLNREPDKRENHEPRMSDLRGSGGIEQSADLVMLLYRPAYYTMQEVDVDSEDDGEAFIVIGKQKNGPIGKVRCGYMPEWMAFMDAPDDKQYSKDLF